MAQARHDTHLEQAGRRMGLALLRGGRRQTLRALHECNNKRNIRCVCVSQSTNMTTHMYFKITTKHMLLCNEHGTCFSNNTRPNPHIQGQLSENYKDKNVTC